MRIAVTSTNGKDLNLHFGKANSLYIYEYDEKNEKIKFIEQRKVELDKGVKHQNPKILKAIADCEVAICEKFGFKASIHAKEAGIKLIEDKGTVEEVINRYIDHLKFMKNIKI